MDTQKSLSRPTQRPAGSRPSRLPPRRTTAAGEQPTSILPVSAGPEPRAPRSRRFRHPARTATRVLLVVHNALYRCGLRALLEGQPDLEIAGEAHDCREAAKFLRRLDASVVLLDPRGPGISPMAAVRALSSHPLLVLASSGGEPVEEAAALRAGACGLVLTTVNPVELAAALRVIAAGYTLHLPPTNRTAEEEETREIAPGKAPTEFLNLTQREQQVFRLMVSGFGNAEIAKILTLGESTIKSHVQHLLTKLDIPNRVHAVIYAYRHGLVTEYGRPLVTGPGSGTSASAVA